MAPSRDVMHAARRALGIDELVLTVHDASFPSRPDEDIGRGSPYGFGADDLIAFADGLGFTGIQLGPQGETTRVNRSPYDGTVFTKSTLSIALQRLARDPAWEGLLEDGVVAATVDHAPSGPRVAYEYAFDAQRRALDHLFTNFERRATATLRERLRAFEAGAHAWLPHDALYEARAFTHGTDDARRWPLPEPLGPDAERVARRFAFAQFVVHAQHDAFRERLSQVGWKLWGDLQVGLSPRDVFGREALFLPGYRMGAPASRTEPLGQAWGYPVLDPRSAAAEAFFVARVTKAVHELDGLRIDHPHGLVCPWVYEAGAADSLGAVAHGARLFESPNLPDHPALAAFAIAEAAQIDPRVPRYADGWVTALTEPQVSRYALRFEQVIRAMRASSGRATGLLCEVLSTCPYPLERVLRRYDLGRFRVTQKANPHDPRDVYRSENAEPIDWIMVGNHDTPPLPAVIDRWEHQGELRERAAYLASLLMPAGEDRDSFARELLRSRSAFTRAMTAQLFASPARHVSVFFADLFGLRERYNAPGVVDDVNWTLRVPRDFRRAYQEGTTRGDALPIANAFTMALRAKAGTGSPDLLDALGA